MSERIYGVTPPISTALPTEPEKRLNNALHQELRAQGTFETPAETEKRREVLRQLEKITNVFVQRAAAEKEPKNTILIRDAIGRVFTYGSYRLGVYGPGSDMDTLVVAPKYVTVDQYFKIFPEVLVEMAPPAAITDLTPVPEAFVPIIKFEFSGISIDLIFCSIQTLKQLPDDKNWSLADNNLLRGLSENEVRSLNGTRVTDDILNLVPEPATFKLALRAIKLWAQRKAIYANIMGYPGGVAWAMLVARVCQLYPKATSAVVVNKFFHIMVKWPWPLPVLLQDIEYGCPVTRVAVWNPKLYASDRHHKMPIITPSYPSMCATHNIGRSSMAVIKQELEKGVQVTEDIMLGRRPWKDLFTKHTFFTSGFRYYITVIASSRTKKAQNVWSGFVESRVRVLVNKLEMHPSIALARPFNKGYDREHRCKDNVQVEEVVSVGSLAHVYKPPADGVKAEPKQEVKTENGVPVKEEKPEVRTEDGMRIKREHSKEAQLPPPTDIKPESTDDADAEVKLADIPEHKNEPEHMEVYTTNHYIGLQLVEGAKSLDLSREVNDWKAMCTSNELYEEGLMFLSIQHVKNTTLPDDVFEPGETKPRPVKKGLKRVASEEPGNRPAQPPAKRQVQGKAPPTAQQQRQQQQQQQQQPTSTATAAAG
ncbi:Poly(A) polymerase central domain-containing protein [Parachaetomium inaequale]|uniref:Poly(A) polymerase n=1 Tax=Parachaetomium inaequale TaxID=2588326 RepID=A0AAN6PRP0_9PEZI|nr:Poly(A) polymerase central domain-containing protein [Parachaetomium inaequale]